MIQNKFTAAPIWQGSTLCVMLSAYWADGATLVTQSSLSAITRQVSCLVEGVWQTLAADTLTISAVISNTLQIANGWNVDSSGYNLRDVVPAARFSNIGTTCIVYTLTGTDGTVSVIEVQTQVQAPLS